MAFRPRVFETRASASSATPAGPRRLASLSEAGGALRETYGFPQFSFPLIVAPSYLSGASIDDLDGIRYT